jgi:hypothetical protein
MFTLHSYLLVEIKKTSDNIRLIVPRLHIRFINISRTIIVKKFPYTQNSPNEGYVNNTYQIQL